MPCNTWASAYSMFGKCTIFIRCSMDYKFRLNMVTPTLKKKVRHLDTCEVFNPENTLVILALVDYFA